MKLPRGISSDRLIRHLEREWDYRFSRQLGSHIVLTTETPRHHSVPIPVRSEIGTGLFRSIVKQVCEAKGVSMDELLRGL